MNVSRYRPSEILKPFIDDYALVRGSSAFDSRILPVQGLTMAFRIDGSVLDEYGQQLPAQLISGISRSAALVRYTPGTATLIVRFSIGGAAVFTRENLYALSGNRFSLDDIFPKNEIAVLTEQFAAAKDDPGRISLIERFLLKQMVYPKPDALIQEAVFRIKAANGNIRIQKLADELYISTDPFEKRFRQATGSTPKHFASITRLQSVIQSYRPATSLTRLGLSAGYFDQAHFIREFRALTGLPPKAFFAAEANW